MEISRLFLDFFIALKGKNEVMMVGRCIEKAPGSLKKKTSTVFNGRAFGMSRLRQSEKTRDDSSNGRLVEQHLICFGSHTWKKCLKSESRGKKSDQNRIFLKNKKEILLDSIKKIYYQK